MIEGEKIVRRRGALAAMAARQRDVDPRHSGGRHQQPGGPGQRPGPDAQRRPAPARPAPSKGGSQTDTRQPDQQHAAAAAARPGVAGRRGRRADPKGSFERAGASTIYREQGKRLIAVKFSVRGRDLGGAVDEAKQTTAEHRPVALPRRCGAASSRRWRRPRRRLMFIVPAVAGADLRAAVPGVPLRWSTPSWCSATWSPCRMGGIWALLLTGTNFSISAAVGFMSHLRRGHHGRPAADLLLQRPAGARACRCAKRSWKGRPSGCGR